MYTLTEVCQRANISTPLQHKIEHIFKDKFKLGRTSGIKGVRRYFDKEALDNYVRIADLRRIQIPYAYIADAPKEMIDKHIKLMKETLERLEVSNES